MMVFIGSPPYPRGHARRKIREQVIDAWRLLHDVEIVTSITRPEERWRKAETLAQLYTSCPYYVLADDDCEPLAPVDLAAALLVLNRLQDVAIASFAMPEQNFPGDFYPLHAVGGIRIIRAGVMDFPYNFHGHDSEAYNVHIKKGYRSGVLPFLHMIHLGDGLSTNWRYNSFFPGEAGYAARP